MRLFLHICTVVLSVFPQRMKICRGLFISDDTKIRYYLYILQVFRKETAIKRVLMPDFAFVIAQNGVICAIRHS